MDVIFFSFSIRSTVCAEEKHKEMIRKSVRKAYDFYDICFSIALTKCIMCIFIYL